MDAPVLQEQVELGFVEDREAALLKSRFFPSKVGGKPAWLALNNIPKPEQLSCRICAKPTIFLLQVYSPKEDSPEAFHRTLFLFVCSNPDCSKVNNSDNLIIFRSQLSRENDFYSTEPPKVIPLQWEPKASNYQSLCVVCGCSGPKSCGKCHKRSYCSRRHQTIDWKAGHNKSCGVDGNFYLLCCTSLYIVSSIEREMGPQINLPI